MSGFDQALRYVLGIEKGFSDHPADSGGATQWGITEAVYHRWRADQNLSPRPVRQITVDEMRAIYHQNYWIDGGCERFPWPASLVHFDGCVNHGIRGAWGVAQRAVGVHPDGIVGPVTEGALQHAIDHGVPLLVREMLWERIRKYGRIVAADSSQHVFLNGWLNRMDELRDRVIQDMPEAA